MKLKPREDKTIIADEWAGGEYRPEYLCSFCNITLVRLRDAGQNNTTYWCKHCSVEFDPEAENIRKEAKIIVPDRNQEAAISSIQTDPTKAVEKDMSRNFVAALLHLQRKGPFVLLPIVQWRKNKQNGELN